MNFYVAALILYLVIIPTVIAASIGLWQIIIYCRRQYTLARLWDDIQQVRKIGASAAPVPRGELRGLTEAGAGNSRPYDWQDDAA